MNRVFIELYCLHDTDSKTVKKQIFKVKMIYGLAMGHRYVPSDNSGYSAIQKAEVAFLSSVGKRMPLKRIFSMYEKCVNEIPTGSGDLYFKPSVPLPVQERNVFDKKLFAEYQYVDIRNDKAKAPCEYIKILESLYSDWKKLPPEKDRHPGHFDLDNVEIW